MAAAVQLSGVSAGGDIRIERIRYICNLYQIFPAAESGPRLTATVKERLNRLLARHTLFGGREAELEHLEAFPTRRPSGYLFVTGRSGFGKTALLTNWVSRLLRDEEAVCYHFISRVDDVADEEFALVNLCQQLVAFHGLTGELPPRNPELRSLYATLLSIPPLEGKRLVVVLEGLEEALNWTPGPDLFPHPLPDGVYVIFSAGEVTDLDWPASLELPREAVETIQLAALGTHEITHLLKQAGEAAALYAGDAEFVGSLHAVSEGDPFYLRFLVQDIKDGYIEKTNLDQQPVGLKRYLEAWWEQLVHEVDLSGEHTYDLLGILTVAKGSLCAVDLAGISPSLRRGMLLSRELSGKLRRYLIGNPDEGYALFHPRFREYLQDKFLPDELQSYREQLLDYCARWREHRSVYALSYYPTHLFELNQDDLLFALLDKDWMDAQFERTHSHRAFSADVELALAAAVKELTPRSVVQIARNSLIYATLGSLAANAPAKALGVLAGAGQEGEEQAMGYAVLIQDPPGRIKAFCRIGLTLMRQNRTDEAKTILERAISTAEALDVWYYGELDRGQSGAPVLATVVQTLVDAEDADRAAEIADRSVAMALGVPGAPRESVLAEVASVLAQAGFVDQAISAVEAIDNVRARSAPLAEVIRVLVHRGDPDRAVALCDAVSPDWVQIPHFVGLVEALTEVGSDDQAVEAAHRAVAIAAAAENLWYKAPLLAQAARAAATAGMHAESSRLADEALALADGLSNVMERAWALAGVARGLAQSGQVTVAHNIAVSLSNVAATLSHAPSHPSVARAAGRALSETAEFLARTGESEQALEAVRTAESLLLTTDESGNVPVEFALPELADLDKSWLRPPSLAVIRVIAESGPLQQAVAAAEAFTSSEKRLPAQTEIIEVLIGSGRLDAALEVANTIGDSAAKAQALATVAAALTADGRNAQALEVANRAIAESQVVGDPWPQTWALVEVVRILDAEGHFKRADAAAEAIRDPEAKVWALIELSRSLARAGERQRATAVAERAVATARQIEKWSPPFNQFRARSVLLPDSILAIQVVKQRELFRPLTRRAMEGGGWVGPSSISDQENVMALVLRHVVDVLARLGEQDRAGQIVEQVIEQERAENDGRNSFVLLAQASGVLARLGRIDRAREVAERITNPWRAAHALAIVAATLSRLGRVEEASAMADRAMAAVEALYGTADYDQLLLMVVATLVQAGQVDRVYVSSADPTHIIRALLRQREALANVLRFLQETGESVRAAEIVEQAKNAAGDDVEALSEVINALTVSNQHDEVTELADRAEAVANTIRKPDTALTLTGCFSRLGDYQRSIHYADQAIKVAGAIEDPHEQAVAQMEVARALAGIGQVDRALTVAEQITNPTFKASALLQVRLALAEAGQREHAVEVAYRIAAVAEDIRDPAEQARSLVTAAMALGGVGEGGAAVVALVNALLVARSADRSTFFRTLQASAEMLCSIDGCEALWQIHEALLEVEVWWSAK